MRSLNLGNVREIALLAAHCDDLAIGAGGTILQICRANPGLKVRALVMTGAGTVREGEEREALRRLCPGADLEVTILGYPDGRTPGKWAEAKADVSRFAKSVTPELVIGPQLADAHQDHRALAEWSWQEFRDHLMLGYEIVKYEGDLPTPQLHVAMSDDVFAQKLAILAECYPSQLDHGWYDEDLFRGIARVRGVHASARWAEAFVTPKLSLNVI